MTEQEIFNVPVPVATKSYAPVAHQSLVSEIREQLDRHNLIVASTTYQAARDGRQLIGFMDINSGDSELGFRLGFRNSYDKSMSAALVAGGVVWICSNGQVRGDIAFIRKHTGSIVHELKNKIEFAINTLQDDHIILNRHKESMKSIQTDREVVAQLAGELFLNQDIITSTQLNILKREIDKPSFDYNAPNSLWETYNHLTHALKTSHPTEYFERHQRLHEFVETEYELI